MKFSVIIPTFNRPADLDRCLAALARLEYPSDEFEVIVVDDGGHVDLQTIVAAYRNQLRLTLLRQTNSGPGVARNKGAEQASSRYLAFIDDDCIPAPTWLQILDGAVARASNALLGGRVVNGLPNNLNSEASQAIVDYLHQHMNGDPEHGRFFPSNNIAVAADLYRQIGGFDANFRRNASEDRDFCDRWLRHGLRLVAVPDAVVVHSREMSFLGFWKQHFQYGRGAYSYAVARRRRNGGPVPFEGWRFHAGMILAPLRKSVGPQPVYLSFLIFISQVAIVAGYGCQAREGGQQGALSYKLARK